MNIGGFEIEKKYLISYPDESVLAQCRCSEISQTYLKGEEGTTERVRRRADENGCVYTHTVKRKLSDMRRIENESEISEEEYNELLRRRDEARRVIEKKRCVLDYKNQLFEIDLFPFWNDRAYMEIELTDESDSIELPPFVHIIKDVTADDRYNNSSLAVEIPMDEI